jgi:hypothetical protein
VVPVLDAGEGGPGVYVVRTRAGACVVRGLIALDGHRESLYIAELYFGAEGIASMGLPGAKLCGPTSPYRVVADAYERQRHA